MIQSKNKLQRTAGELRMAYKVKQKTEDEPQMMIRQPGIKYNS